MEFQVHGGPAVIAAMVTSLGKLPSYRHAEPGEFTKRSLQYVNIAYIYIFISDVNSHKKIL